MQVSFVIPTRNQAQFIRKCIDRCLGQSSGGEVIVVDGASTDGTPEILREYGGRIRFVSEKDSGQSEALNKGVRMATGDVIAWINSDDYYPHERVLEKVLAQFSDDVDIVYGDSEMVDAAGSPLRMVRAKRIDSPRDLVLSPGGFTMQPAVFFRRQTFLDAGGLDLSLHYTMDYELWIRLFGRARKWRYLPESLACATYHESAKSIQFMWKQIGETALVKRRYLTLLRGPADRLLLEGGVASMYVYWGAVRLGLKRAF
jgi:glycosyltransferase involved in cell wall biosynthesis